MQQTHSRPICDNGGELLYCYMKARKQAVRSWSSESEKEKTECKGGLNSPEVEGYSDFSKNKSNIDALLFALHSFFFFFSLSALDMQIFQSKVRLSHLYVLF